MLMSGYLDEPEKTAAVFDEDGYYRTGDMAVFHDEAHPEQGLAFAGRMAEEFKLTNGTWVYGGQLREALLKALSPLVTEIVLADDNRPFLTLLVWPKADAPADLLDQFVERLRDFNAGQQGGSATIRRVAILTSPPSRRCARDFGQGHDQPPRGARSPQRPRRAALCRHAGPERRGGLSFRFYGG